MSSSAAAGRVGRILLSAALLALAALPASAHGEVNNIEPVAITASAGSQFSGQVATFESPGGGPFEVLIDWGDGSAAGEGSSAAAGKSFIASGTHTYAKAGAYSVKVTVLDTSDKSKMETTTSATVSAPAPPPPPPPPSTPAPTAALSVLTPAPTAGSPVYLSGVGSSAGSGTIVSYAWDFSGSGEFTTSTGTIPTARFVFTSGTHRVVLRITNSAGQTATSGLTLHIPGASSSTVNPLTGSPGGCDSQVTLGTVILYAACVVANHDGSGYTISGPVLTFNGMTLEPRAGGTGTWNISTSAAGDFLSGSPVTVVMPNTPIGSVQLGTLELTNSPLDITHAADTAILAGHGPHARASDTAPNLGIRLATFGVGHSCAAGDSNPTCCPPAAGNTACASLPSGIPLEGQISIYLNAHAELYLDVSAAVNFRVVAVTGDLQIHIDVNGVHLDELAIGIPHLLLGPLRVCNAEFQYYFLGYADPVTGETSKADSWDAKASVVFNSGGGSAAGAGCPDRSTGPVSTTGAGAGGHEFELSGDVGVKQGNFDHAAAALTISPGIPIYAGIFLNHFAANLAVNPLGFGGGLGAQIARALELRVDFQFSVPTATHLGYFGGRGTLELQGNTIATLQAEVFTDGFVDAGVAIDIHYPFDQDANAAPVRVSGEIGFWDEPTSGRWEASGEVHLKLLQFLDNELAGLVNNEGIAGCFGIDGFGIAGRYHFADERIEGGAYAFRSCNDELSRYRNHPLVSHCGPFTPGGCISAASPADAVILPSGTAGQELRLSATSTPTVKVTSPDGRLSFTTPSTPGVRVDQPGVYLATLAPDTHQLLILLVHPQGGRWRIDPVAGAPAITTVEVAADTPPPVITAHVEHARGPRWTLAYRIANFVAGARIRFVERGADSTRILGTASSASGSIRFTPVDALARKRTISADILGADGQPKAPVAVAQLLAPPAQRAGRPGPVVISRRGTRTTVRWGAAANARRYVVVVRGSDGRINQFVLSARTRTLTITRALAFDSYSASVQAFGGPNMLSGPQVAGRLRGQRVKPVRLPRHPRRLAHLPGTLTP